MKVATSHYNEPEKDRGIGRMIAVSALVHVAVIGGILAFSWTSPSHRGESRLPSYEVTLIAPSRQGGMKPGGTTAAIPAPVPAGENPLPSSPPRERAEALAPKPQVQPKAPEPPQAPVKEVPPKQLSDPPKTMPVTKAETAAVVKEKEPAKPQKQAKAVVKEEPAQKPQKQKTEATPKPPLKKEAESPPPEKTPVAAKPLAKPPPARPKQPEPKPTVKTPQAQVKPQPPAAKPQEKTPEPPPAQPKKEKAQPAQPKVPEKTPSLAKTGSEPKVTKATPAPVATKAPTPEPGEKKATDKKEEHEREKQIAAAVERARARDESVARESNIAQALERVRQRIGENGEGAGPTQAQAKVNVPSQVQGGTAANNTGAAKVYGAEFIAYTENIKQRVKDGWLMPERRPGLTAIVRFILEPDGSVADVEIVKPSGDSAFDQSALRAVRTAKLPPPPEAYREEFAMQKVHITFKGEE